MYCSLACVLSAAEDLKLGEREHAVRLGTSVDAERDRARVLERAETMIRRGMSAKAAADVLQVPPAALRTWLKAAGIPVVPDPVEAPTVTPVFAAPGSVPPSAAGAGRAGPGAVQAVPVSQVGAGAGAPDAEADGEVGVGSGAVRGEGSAGQAGSTGPGLQKATQQNAVQKEPSGAAPSGSRGAGSRGAGRKGVVPGGVKPGQDPVLGKYTSPRALLHHWRQVERIADLEIGAVPAGVGKSGHPQGFAATVSARLLVGDTAGEVVVCTATEGAKMKACDVAAYALAKILRPIMDTAAAAAAGAGAATSAAAAGAAATAAPAPVSAPAPAPGSSAVSVSAVSVVPDARLVREWARENGYTVGERGRLPAHVRDAYLAAVAGPGSSG